MADTLILLNGANPVHVAFGECVGADSFTITGRVAKGQFAPLKALRLVKNSLSVPTGYENVLCESCYYYPAIKRRLGMLGGSKIININCGPLIYNIHSGRLGGLERKALLSLLREVDAHLVFGEYGEELLGKADPGKPTGIVYPFIGEDRYARLFRTGPALDSKEITIIGNDDPLCKGIDVLVAAFNGALEHDPKLVLNIVTNIPEATIRMLDGGQSGRIRHMGMVKDVAEVLARSALYVHPSRGDTFPRASLEAMAAGVPNIVSGETGTKELVVKADEEMVCRLDARDLAERIIRYFALPLAERKKRSAAVRELARPFSRQEQLANFRGRFAELRKLV